MELPTILPNRHPLASAIRLKRRYSQSSLVDEMPVEVEFIDFDRATVGDAVALCMDGEESRRASAVCALSHKRGADCPPQDNAVYVVASRGGEAAKIGMAVNPASRLCNLQSGHWAELELCGLFWCIGGDAAILERAALRAASAMGLSLRGEWFDAAPDLLGLIVASAAKGAGIRISDSAMWIRQREAIRRQILFLKRGIETKAA